jgi:hypothetical protein
MAQASFESNFVGRLEIFPAEYLIIALQLSLPPQNAV